MRATVMIIGAYGFFGSRIAESLADDPSIRLLLAGRNRNRATELAARLHIPPDQAVAVDAHSPALGEVLRARAVNILIHTAGPFQGQDYRVAEAAIGARCHYVDLADGRSFVGGIGKLEAAARAAEVTVVSGASSVPALSSAAVARLARDFDRLDEVHIGITSGARSPGTATLAGILAYCGKPITRLQDGRPVLTHGWQDLSRHRFPAPVGGRLLGSCDVPDLDLLPDRYPSLRSVTFQGGYGSAAGHLLVWALAGLVRSGLVRSAAPLAPRLQRLSEVLAPLVSDKGGMFVRVAGERSGRSEQRGWYLLAFDNHGPHIPCGGAIAITRKLREGRLPPGATPCVGLLGVDEYLAPLRGLNIRQVCP